MFNKKTNKERGFTLIELLVVISILSLLSTVILGSIGDAREKARYKKFGQEIDQLQKAMQLYYQDNGNYPLHGEFNQNINTTLVETLVNEGYLSSKIDFLDTINLDNTVYYSDYSSYLFCDGKAPVGEDHYAIFIYDPSVDYGEEVLNRFNGSQIFDPGNIKNTDWHCLYY